MNCPLCESVPSREYARDITHINFVRHTTMLRVADMLNRGVVYTDGREVVLLG